MLLYLKRDLKRTCFVRLLTVYVNILYNMHYFMYHFTNTIIIPYIFIALTSWDALDGPG